jgi:hypothetical protein
MNDTVTQFCICDLDLCYCAEAAKVPIRQAEQALAQVGWNLRGPAMPAEWTCPECSAGHHVGPDGVRR